MARAVVVLEVELAKGAGPEALARAVDVATRAMTADRPGGVRLVTTYAATEDLADELLATLARRV